MGRIFAHKGKCPAEALCTRWSPVAGKYCRCCCKGAHRSAACISAAFVSATIQVGPSLRGPAVAPQFAKNGIPSTARHHWPAGKMWCISKELMQIERFNKLSSKTKALLV